MQSVFKIEGVLTGDARVVALEGRDAADRRVRLELPAEEAASMGVGTVLVVQWWAAELPGDASSLGATGPSTTPSSAEAARSATPSSAEAARSEVAASTSEMSVSDRVDAEFRRLMGLR